MAWRWDLHLHWRVAAVLGLVLLVVATAFRAPELRVALTARGSTIPPVDMAPWYTPMSALVGLVLLEEEALAPALPLPPERPNEVGRASWYGPGFDGRPTANGEIFDETALTAAHRSLALPSLVRVTNLENGRSLVLKVNDRGPYRAGRIIDVSKSAARRLGFLEQGLARVRVEVIAEGRI